MKKHFTLNEHKYLFVEKDESKQGWNEDGNVGIPEIVFNQIDQYVKQNDDESSYFLKPGYRKGYKYILKAQQYVGVIKTKSGVSVEILPKISKIDYSERNKGSEGKTEKNQEKVRKTFIKMLKRLKDSKYKQFQTASLNSCKMPLLELFISMFLDELAILVRKGIRSDYINKEENAPFLKGKLLMSKQIKHNYIHKERFFISFDEYSPNRIENKLIKSTLLFLNSKTSSNANSKRIKENLFIFDLIDTSTNPKADFDKVKDNRNIKYYENVMSWCRMLLNNESITPFKGDTVAFALLFDMNRIFEDYVAWWLKRKLSDKYDTFQAQDKGHHLIESHQKYKLKPDIVINGNIILDTKWKLIKNVEKDISQADLYQMYAYGKKYKNEDEKQNKLFLIYPMNEELDKDKKKLEETHYYDNGKILPLEVLFFDCGADEKDGIKNIGDVVKIIK
ncbi:MAG: McrC family protein [Candidatus Delongbacteria bacterium]|nr:McrC family protein [Candidatus Delongbacteria bacterium]